MTDEPPPGTVETAERPPRSRPRRRGWFGRLSRRWRIAVWLLFAAWLALGAYLLFGLSNTPPPDDADRGARAPDAPAPVLWVANGPGGSPPALALLHAGPPEPTVVLLPVSTLMEVPGHGPRPLGAALTEFGDEAVTTAIANVLRVEVPGILVSAPEQLVGLVDAVGPVTVDVPATLEVEEGNVLRTVFRAGRTQMDGAELVELLTFRGPEERETDRVSRQAAGWRGLFAALEGAERSELATALEGWTGDLTAERNAEMLSGVARGDGGPTALSLPVRRSPVPGDIYEVEEEELGTVRQALASIRITTVDEGRVRLLVGAEGPVGPAAARTLIEGGYEIVLTGRAQQPYDVTRVVVAENSPELRASGRRIIDLLGAGELGVFRRPQTVFDVTLVVGRDWGEANGFPQPEPSPTDG